MAESKTEEAIKELWDLSSMMHADEKEALRHLIAEARKVPDLVDQIESLQRKLGPNPDTGKVRFVREG